MIAFMAILYGVYMGALVMVGTGLYLGVFPGSHPFAITVIPAIFGAAVIVMFLAVSLLPGDFDRLVGGWHRRAAGEGGRPRRRRPGRGGQRHSHGDRAGPLEQCQPVRRRRLVGL